MRSHAHVVIVGGGIMGTSLLFHLAREGWTDCVLIEKSGLTSGSTWHAAGLVAHLSSSLPMAQITSHAVGLYPRLEAMTGHSASWHGCGGLYLAFSEDELDWLRQVSSVCRGLDHPAEIVGPGEIARLFPFYGLDGVKAALHTMDDGHVDPAGACHALAAGARALGAEIVQSNRVTDICPLPNGEWQVISEQGTIICEHVVNAGGAYARQIGEWTGLDLAVANTTHHYVVTGNIPEFADLPQELPVIRDMAAFSGYCRMEQLSGLIGIYEKKDPATVWDDGAPWEAEHELFEPHLDRIGPWLEIAMERMPVFRDAGIRRIFHGAIPDTPDGNMLLGPAPGLRNYWCCCAAQTGIAWGPGAGKYLAQWMMHGAAEISMKDVDPRRYGSFAQRAWVLEKTKEDYVLHRAVPYPGLNRPAARPAWTSTLHGRLMAEGAVFEEVYGREQPRWFARRGTPQQDIYSFRRSGLFDIVGAECRMVATGVGVADLAAFSKAEVEGPDAASFLDRLVANRLPSRDGGIVLAHLLNRAGTIEAEVVVTRLHRTCYYLTFAAYLEQRLLDWFECHRHTSERLAVRCVTDVLGCLAVAGPRSRDVMAAVTGTLLDNANFPWFSCRTIDIGGTQARALRLSYSGELGWEIHAPATAIEQIHDAVMTAGQEYGIGYFGSFALNSMRLEKGYHAGSELTNEVTLPEAAAARFFKPDKGDFIGRDATLARLKQPPRWRCTSLEVEAGDADCHGGETVYLAGEVAGFISSGGYGHRVSKSLAFAFLAPGAVAEPRELHVDILGEFRLARIIEAPPYDPGNERPRAAGR